MINGPLRIYDAERAVIWMTFCFDDLPSSEWWAQLVAGFVTHKHKETDMVQQAEAPRTDWAYYQAAGIVSLLFCGRRAAGGVLHNPNLRTVWRDAGNRWNGRFTWMIIARAESR